MTGKLEARDSNPLPQEDQAVVEEHLPLRSPMIYEIAAIAWITPNAESARFSVVVWLTYLVALGDFTHVVVGSAELGLLVFGGSVSPGHALAVLLPTLAGNVIGGTGLFSLLAYAQIKGEI
jgi:formate/nitrite transporter FocA (FNT family)